MVGRYRSRVRELPANALNGGLRPFWPVDALQAAACATGERGTLGALAAFAANEPEEPIMGDPLDSALVRSKDDGSGPLGPEA